MSTITGYHAHVYYDAANKCQADELCRAASNALRVQMGRMHDAPVGPHPRGSCQLAFGPDQLGAVLAWLITHRAGLTVFAHALTGDALKDHTEYVIWLGASEQLNLSALTR
jgi:DOPA 4,5-dioxygenase